MAELAPKPAEAARSEGSFKLDRQALILRPMTTDDLDAVMVIERTSYRYPWSAGFFLQELQAACARSIIAEMDGRIIGYTLYWLLPESVDIHNIAVHVDFRRRGLGRLLLETVVGEARRYSAHRVTLEVRKSNFAAQKLYALAGFVATGVRKGYYSDDGEDALAMTLDLQQP